MPVPAGVVSVLRGARHVLVLTGSGASAESGVPTFREARTGLWESFNPLELATPDAFLRDPELVWRWYRWRREVVADAQPNAGHFALARLAERVPKLTLITQNVDGLHQRAGSRNVVEFHGNLFVNRCVNTGCGAEAPAADEKLPRCPLCSGLLRPGVVWFGEVIPPAALDIADAASADCDVFLSVGTSSLVWPAAGLVESAGRNGATVIEINIGATPMTELSHFVLKGKAGELLPELVDCLDNQDEES